MTGLEGKQACEACGDVGCHSFYCCSQAALQEVFPQRDVLENIPQIYRKTACKFALHFEEQPFQRTPLERCFIVYYKDIISANTPRDFHVSSTLEYLIQFQVVSMW